MRSGGSTWLLPARSFFIGCGAGLAAAAWNPTNVCPRLLCPLRSIVATLALPNCRHSCRPLRGHFANPSVKSACLDSCLDKAPSSKLQVLKFCKVLLSRRTPPHQTASRAASGVYVGGWVGGWGVSGLGSARDAVRVVQPRLRDFTVKSGAMCHCLDAVWTLSGRCLDAVWTLSGRCLDTVWTGSGLSRQVRELHKPGSRWRRATGAGAARWLPSRPTLPRRCRWCTT